MEKRYDPGENPDSKDWLALDGEQKLRLIQQYHRKNGIRLRNARLHALIHAAVENQVALGNQIPVRAALLKLMSEGLSRHDAIHTLGIVLRKHVPDMESKSKNPELSVSDQQEILQLTAEDLLHSFDDDD